MRLRVMGTTSAAVVLSTASSAHDGAGGAGGIAGLEGTRER